MDGNVYRLKVLNFALVVQWFQPLYYKGKDKKNIRHTSSLINFNSTYT